MENVPTKKWKLKEITLTVVVSIALGVVWWGWTLIYEVVTPFLQPSGLNYLLVGFWFTGGTLVPYIIRKPGAAFFAETLAAVVEGFITHWGVTALFWGLIQGAFSEGAFALFRYKKYTTGVMLLAGAAAGVGEYILDYFYSRYSSLGLRIIAVQIVCILISGALLGGLLAKAVGDGLKKTGALNQFLIVHES